ncbi:hypothetical protein Ae201684P_017378 [Aphanomyces euteiches]|uniref:Uncharacterized protein n=1 Tax=Aphanomyces euteiches TaxID=100861 RepID=A0A6G0W4L7_9STRA|nr:hypothetical protein Ae201684_018799 [Aphanomyces euteiches]KAH9051885.1 hypothetical protein Ae201684P_017366 [Aphanomyces euteiches]KAH9051898.1 hypothetical protein Ae201684P_017378 [Aphanomyces euteiches]
MRLLLTLALALSAFTAASRSPVENQLDAFNSRNLLEAAPGKWSKAIPRAGLKGKLWANYHLDKHGKAPFGYPEKNVRTRGQLANPMKRGRSPLSNPERYDSPELKRARIEHHSDRK